MISKTTADALTEMMRANVERGTGTRAAVDDTQSAGLTGTDTDFRAAWFVGSSGQLSTAVWLALPTGDPMLAIEGRNVTGGSFPAEAWARITAGYRDTNVLIDPPEPPERLSVPPCPIGFPEELDPDGDGRVDGCRRLPRENPFVSSELQPEVEQDSCPSTHPSPTDINGDGINDTCGAAGFANTAPAADFGTSIDVKMQLGQPAVDRYNDANFGRSNYREGTLVFVGTALSGTETAELFRWYTKNNPDDRGPSLGRCFGAANPQGGNATCEQIDRPPAAGPGTGGAGPTSEGSVEIDPTWKYLLDNAPVGAAWFVVDATEGARVIANVVGEVSYASWPSEAGGPQLITVLDHDHNELWSFTLD